MNASRKAAIIVGVLYILGTVAGVTSVVLTSPILQVSDYLGRVSANESQLVTGALFVLVMGFALAMVPVVAFPILRRHNETLALAYVVFRGGLETVTCIALVFSWLMLLPLGRAYVQAGAPATSGFQSLGALVMGAASTCTTLGTIVFPLGALMFYYVLFQSRLIPRWISGWGLIAIIPYLAAGLLLMFGLISTESTTHTILVGPMALQEMVMAVWLIARGFSPSAIASQPATRLETRIA